MNKVNRHNWFEGFISYPVIITTVTRQNRKHHKTRINKKWAKRYGVTTYDIQTQDIVLIDNKFYVTKKGYELLRLAVEENNQCQIEQMIKDYKN